MVGEKKFLCILILIQFFRAWIVASRRHAAAAFRYRWGWIMDADGGWLELEVWVVHSPCNLLLLALAWLASCYYSIAIAIIPLLNFNHNHITSQIKRST
jgi:hypothetical protein